MASLRPVMMSVNDTLRPPPHQAPPTTAERAAHDAAARAVMRQWSSKVANPYAAKAPARGFSSYATDPAVRATRRTEGAMPLYESESPPEQRVVDPHPPRVATPPRAEVGRHQEILRKAAELGPLSAAVDVAVRALPELFEEEKARREQVLRQARRQSRAEGRRASVLTKMGADKARRLDTPRHRLLRTLPPYSLRAVQLRAELDGTAPAALTKLWSLPDNADGHVPRPGFGVRETDRDGGSEPPAHDLTARGSPEGTPPPEASPLPAAGARALRSVPDALQRSLAATLERRGLGEEPPAPPQQSASPKPRRWERERRRSTTRWTPAADPLSTLGSTTAQALSPRALYVHQERMRARTVHLSGGLGYVPPARVPSRDRRPSMAIAADDPVMLAVQEAIELRGGTAGPGEHPRSRRRTKL